MSKVGGNMLRRLLTIFLVFQLAGCLGQNLSLAAPSPGKQMMDGYKQPLPVYFSPKTLHIAALGDSLTQGVGDESNRGGYLFYLEKELSRLKGVKDVQLDNYGVRGHESGQLLSRIQKEEVKAAVEQADLVLLTIGGNDIMEVVKKNIFHLRMEEFREKRTVFEKNLRQIFRIITDSNPNSTILLIGLYNPFSYWFSDIPQFQVILDEFNDVGKRVVSDYGNSYFVPIDDLFSGNSLHLLYEDRFHPNERGYELIANRVFSSLQRDVVPVRNNEWFVVKEDGQHE